MELEPLTESRTMDGTLEVTYAPEDLLRAVVILLVALGDTDRAAALDRLVKGQ